MPLSLLEEGLSFWNLCLTFRRLYFRPTSPFIFKPSSRSLPSGFLLLKTLRANGVCPWTRFYRPFRRLSL
jgi:hypothetical protein